MRDPEKRGRREKVASLVAKRRDDENCELIFLFQVQGVVSSSTLYNQPFNCMGCSRLRCNWVIIVINEFDLQGRCCVTSAPFQLGEKINNLKMLDVKSF